MSQYSNHLAPYAPNRRVGSVFIPAPIKGWNTMDPQGLMKKDYALELVNFVPMENGLVTRGGTKPWCLITGEVKTLMEYKGGETVFAVADGKIYKLPAASGGTVTESKTGLLDSSLQYTQIGTDGGDFLWCCNGAEAPFYYNGTEWTTTAITAASGVTIDPTKMISVTVYQHRLFMVEKNSMNLWYLPTEQLTGEAKPLLLGAYCTRGGHLVSVSNLTIDGGYGPDDYLVVATSEGEILTFKGRNPDESTMWSMVGRFQISRPIGYRCVQKYGGDLIFVTEAGIAGISSMLSNELAGLTGSSTEKVQSAWAKQARLHRDNPGWQITLYHRRGLLYINMPTEMAYTQWVYDLKSGAWSRLEGRERARCLVETNGNILAGYDNCIMQWDVGFNDEDESGVKTPINAKVQQAFIFPGGTGKRKNYTILRPYIISRRQPQIGVAIATDSVPSPKVIKRVLNFDPRNIFGSKWNQADWGTAVWGIRGDTEYAERLITKWVNTVGHGYSVSAVIEASSYDSSVIYAGCDIQFEVGNAL